MIRLALISLIIGFYSHAAIGQNMNAYQNEIFKEAEPAENQTEIHISDFSFKNQAAARNTFLNAPKTNPGVAFVASAIIPGSGQAFNKKWVRAGIYFTAEVLGIVYHLDRNATARRQEKAYEEYTHQNWSVMAYAQWIVQYSDANNLNQAQLEELRNMVFEDGRPKTPNWGNTTDDWKEVDLSVLHDVEGSTRFILNSPEGCWNNDPPNCNRRSNFSHDLPTYGSQQYYELISKYYQYQPGWRDWHNTVINENADQYDPNHIFAYMWNGKDEPNGMFYEGRDRAEEFNDNYRVAGNILKLLLVNHVVSAFDAFITVKLKNSRIETEANLLKMEQFSMTWHF